MKPFPGPCCCPPCFIQCLKCQSVPWLRSSEFALEYVVVKMAAQLPRLRLYSLQLCSFTILHYVYACVEVYGHKCRGQKRWLWVTTQVLVTELGLRPSTRAASALCTEPTLQPQAIISALYSFSSNLSVPDWCDSTSVVGITFFPVKACED